MPELRGMDKARQDLAQLLAASELLEPGAFSPRTVALDELDYIHEVLRSGGLRLRVEARACRELVDRLDALNRQYCAELLGRLQAGSLTPAELRAELNRHTGYTGSSTSLHLEHEPVDRLVDGMLGLGESAVEPTFYDRDYVHLEDTPVRVLLDLIDHVPLSAGQCFVDLGSGLGRAAILVHWLTGATVEGIEVQPAYHARAEALAASLGLERVHFVLGDAAQADLSQGDVFYLFTPFKGRILRAVWATLAQQARLRPLTVCTYGAVSLAAAQQPWLRPAEGRGPHEFALAIWRAG
ncbi:MAG: hypothetical protein ACOX2L_10900 [Anaerolineae bacterium]|nr:hypothetical protein [Chloroflexota bacterium]